MKIQKIKIKKEIDGINFFQTDLLGKVVILTGENGSGKTRFIKMLCKHLTNLEYKDNLEVYYADDQENEELYTDAGTIKVANYSHYDALLQPAMGFSPYVVGKAKDLLLECNYEETALNALLVIRDMACGYSEEFKDGKKFAEFKEFLTKQFGISLEEEDGSLKLFGQRIGEKGLSPGQMYLLRIAIACFFNEKKSDMILVLDEPELHLHPNAMITMLVQMRNFFPDSQFWISTHSIELISYIICTETDTTVACFKQGGASFLRSDPSDVIEGLLGHSNMLAYIQRFYNLPDEYAAIQFALECFKEAEIKAGKKGDPQQEMVTDELKPGDVVVDYGAGQGRLLEQMVLDTPELLDKIEYYAFNIPECDAIPQCLQVMRENGISGLHHHTDTGDLVKCLREKADIVFLVNVLHEIDPKDWQGVLQIIQCLLKEDGKLCILERAKLTVGESPYDCGFLMLTDNAAKKLFKKCDIRKHKKKNYLVCYEIRRESLNDIKSGDIADAIKTIRNDAITEIEKLKLLGTTDNPKERYKRGMDLAFWLNQYANAALVLKNKFNLAEGQNGKENIDGA